MILKTRSALSNDQLAKMAPAIFATAPHARTSDKYTFMRTIDVVDALRGAGWSPVGAQQSSVRDISRDGLQRHVVRFGHADMLKQVAKVGESVTELVLRNSHDGTSAFQLDAGRWRFVCGNGMVVSDGVFGKISMMHMFTTPADIVEGSFRVVEQVPQIEASVDGMRSIVLSGDERRAFAESALQLRWDAGAAPLPATDLLAARRQEDRATDLWTTFNTVQENLIRGGQRYLRHTEVNGRPTVKRARTMAIKSITEDTRLNKGLWTLAEEMRKIKATA
jgi:Domain of unknown function (DUF932)